MQVEGNSIKGGSISGTTITGTTIEGGTIRGARIEGLTIEAQNIIGDVIKPYSVFFNGGSSTAILTIPSHNKNRIAYILPVYLKGGGRKTETGSGSGGKGFARVQVILQNSLWKEFNLNGDGEIIQGSFEIPKHQNFEIKISGVLSNSSIGSGNIVIFCTNA